MVGNISRSLASHYLASGEFGDFCVTKPTPSLSVQYPFFGALPLWLRGHSRNRGVRIGPFGFQPGILPSRIGDDRPLSGHDAASLPLYRSFRLPPWVLSILAEARPVKIRTGFAAGT